MRALATAGYVVLGGEWWVVYPDGTLVAAVPPVADGPVMFYTWSVTPRWARVAESWQAFRDRAAYTLAVLRCEVEGIGSLPAIEAAVRRVRPDLWPNVRYNLSFVNRKRYEATAMGPSEV